MKQRYTKAAAVACGCIHWVDEPGYCHFDDDSQHCICADMAEAVVKLHDRDIKEMVNRVLFGEKRNANL